LAVTNARFGGDGWESNPPRTPQQRPADGFEDRGEHQLPYIPDDRARLATGLDGYTLGGWRLAFTATAGAAAALTGLLFVALSINLRQIIANPGLVGRAIEVLIVLSAALILSVLLLMPGQPNALPRSRPASPRSPAPRSTLASRSAPTAGPLASRGWDLPRASSALTPGRSSSSSAQSAWSPTAAVASSGSSQHSLR
jgi:hypothetical protein